MRPHRLLTRPDDLPLSGTGLRPRLVAPGRPDLLLHDVRAADRALARRRERLGATVPRRRRGGLRRDGGDRRRGAGPAARRGVRYELEDAGGRTRVTHTCRTVLRGMARLLAPIAGGTIERKIAADLARLKGVLEAGQ